MKILMICTEKLPVPPIRGGAIQTYIAGTLPFLGKKHDITVLGKSDPSLPDHETIDGIQYVRIPGDIFELYREGVSQYLQSHSFDLIHIFNRPRLVLSVRQAAPQSMINLSMHNDMFNHEKIDPEEAKAVLDEVSSIVTISDYVGNVIRSLYPQSSSKLRTIYSGVDTDRFLPGTDSRMSKIRADIRREHGLENKTVILFAGRLSHNKGVDRLVRSLAELSKKYKDLALIIVGSKWFSQNDVTDYVAYVRALAKKLPIPVVTTGYVSQAEIQNYFAAADLFVCTSIWQEPLARVHYEAMAAGLPIVTTARGGNPEVIQPRENGLVVENPEDPNGFSAAISEILSDKSLQKRMGTRGRELAVSLYEFDRVAFEILEVWENSKHISIATVPQEEVMEENAESVVMNDSVEEEINEEENLMKEEINEEENLMKEEINEEENLMEEEINEEENLMEEEIIEEENLMEEEINEEENLVEEEINEEENLMEEGINEEENLMEVEINEADDEAIVAVDESMNEEINATDDSLDVTTVTNESKNQWNNRGWKSGGNSFKEVKIVTNKSKNSSPFYPNKSKGWSSKGNSSRDDVSTVTNGSNNSKVWRSQDYSFKEEQIVTNESKNQWPSDRNNSKGWKSGDNFSKEVPTVTNGSNNQLDLEKQNVSDDRELTGKRNSKIREFLIGITRESTPRPSGMITDNTVNNLLIDSVSNPIEKLTRKSTGFGANDQRNIKW